MPRARKGSARTKPKKKVLRAARGYFGARSKHYVDAKIAVRRAGAYAYRDRRQLKRNIRNLWITRITAACKMRGTRYSLVMNGLRLAGVTLNRKMLSQIAIEDPRLFDELVTKAKAASTAMPAKPAETAA